MYEYHKMKAWFERWHGAFDFWLTQVYSGHGYFGTSQNDRDQNTYLCQPGADTDMSPLYSLPGGYATRRIEGVPSLCRVAR